MKVGILTQPLRTNYGGILQNYALQQTLKRLGHTPITLDYDSYFSQMRWVLGEIKAKLTGAKHDIEFPKYKRAGQENLNRFISHNINKTKSYVGLPIRDFAQKVDAMVVGSDQVWRPRCNVPEDWLYEMFFRSLLDLNIPKVAYAASFGSAEWEYSAEQTELCSQYVKQFKAISIRENSGVELSRKFLGREAQWVLDPTMLLDAEDYIKICGNENPYKKPTLFAYVLDATTEKVNKINTIAESKGLELFLKGANDDIKRSDSIELWLSWIKNADYVITDSFHGLVFSILFERPFSVYNDSWRGNARFDSLLSLYGLKDRTMSYIENGETAIDWMKVKTIRQAEKLKSIIFLKNNL